MPGISGICALFVGVPDKITSAPVAACPRQVDVHGPATGEATLAAFTTEIEKQIHIS